MGYLLQYGPAAAFYIFALAAQVSGFVSPTVAGALAIIATLLLFVPACHHSHLWHKARKNDGRKGLDSWYFIAPCLIVAAIAIAGAAYGLGLHSVSPSVIQESPPATHGGIRPPKLNTQTAKEDFQAALNAVSKVVHQTDDLLKVSEPIAGNKPLIRADLRGAIEPLEKLQQLKTLSSDIDGQLFSGGAYPLFNRYLPSYRNALLTLMPDDSQNVWQDYNVALYKLTVAVMIVQDAEKHKDDMAAYERAIKNAELRADEFRAPTAAIHEWLGVVTRRIDDMTNAI
jgi:hypothetical protein